MSREVERGKESDRGRGGEKEEREERDINGK